MHRKDFPAEWLSLRNVVSYIDFGKPQGDQFSHLGTTATLTWLGDGWI